MADVRTENEDARTKVDDAGTEYLLIGKNQVSISCRRNINSSEISSFRLMSSFFFRVFHNEYVENVHRRLNFIALK